MITRDSPLSFVEKLGKKCRKCSNCCSHGTGFLAPDDLINISNHFKMHSEDLKKHYLDEVDMYHTPTLRPKKMKEPYGKCVFLDKKGECGIEKVKPLHCKIANCNEHGEELHQWFILNYAVNPEDPQSIRDWAQFLEFKNPIPGGNLHELVKNKARLKRILSYEEL